jgi:hypothetical protein
VDTLGLCHETFLTILISSSTSNTSRGVAIARLIHTGGSVRWCSAMTSMSVAESGATIQVGTISVSIYCILIMQKGEYTRHGDQPCWLSCCCADRRLCCGGECCFLACRIARQGLNQHEDRPYSSGCCYVDQLWCCGCEYCFLAYRNVRPCPNRREDQPCSSDYCYVGLLWYYGGGCCCRACQIGRRGLSRPEGR